MQFVRAEAHEGVNALEAELRALLSQGKRVLWFISGGSNIPVTVQIMNKLDESLTKALTIIPIDERFGPVGHENSNVQQLLDTGFTPKRAAFIPVLTNSPLEITVKHFGEAVTTTLANTDAVVGQLGMGGDGHISGILPHSIAVSATDPVISYEGSDGYTRVTTTFPVLRRLSCEYLFAYGASKKEALENLRDKALPLDEQPAQILKEIPRVYIYNDQIE